MHLAWCIVYNRDMCRVPRTILTQIVHGETLAVLTLSIMDISFGELALLPIMVSASAWGSDCTFRDVLSFLHILRISLYHLTLVDRVVRV